MKGIILIQITSSTTDFFEYLKRNDSVLNVFEISGDYDLLIITKTDSILKFNNLIDSIRRRKIVSKTSSSIVLRE